MLIAVEVPCWLSTSTCRRRFAYFSEGSLLAAHGCKFEDFRIHSSQSSAAVADKGRAYFGCCMDFRRSLSYLPATAGSTASLLESLSLRIP